MKTERISAALAWLDCDTFQKLHKRRVSQRLPLNKFANIGRSSGELAAFRHANGGGAGAEVRLWRLL